MLVTLHSWFIPECDGYELRVSGFINRGGAGEFLEDSCLGGIHFSISLIVGVPDYITISICSAIFTLQPETLRCSLLRSEKDGCFQN